MTRKLKLAIVGCGAATQHNHLPVVPSVEPFELAIFVDPNLERARELATAYGVASVEADYRSLPGRVDAALVILPNHLHAPVTCELLRRGISVLVEKPMALTTREGNAMIEAATISGALLAVGLEMRFFEASRIVKRVLEEGWLGRLERFDLRHGLMLNWPVKTDYLFRREQAGGGVLADSGVHLLDLLLWWLGDEADVEYADDARGGVEANCEIRLRMQSGATGTVELSRIRRLRNSCIIEGDRGRLEVALWDSFAPVRLEIAGEPITLNRTGAHPDTEKRGFPEAFRAQLTDFAGAILQHREPTVSGREGLRSVRLLEACYAAPRDLAEPWTFPAELPGLHEGAAR